MRKSSLIAVLVKFFPAVFLWLAAAGAQAGSITIESPWSRATPPGAPAGAAYLTIHNSGPADRLLSAEAGVGERAELHRSVEEDGSSRMEHLSAVDIPAQGSVSFVPRGLHVMIMDLASPLTEGVGYPLTLHFERAGEITVEVMVKSLRHTGEDGHGHDHDH